MPFLVVIYLIIITAVITKVKSEVTYTQTHVQRVCGIHNISSLLIQEPYTVGNSVADDCTVQSGRLQCSLSYPHFHSCLM